MAVAGGAVYLMSKGDLAQAASVGATGAEVASKVENEAPAATEVAQETGNAEEVAASTNQYGINASELKFSNTAENHFYDLNPRDTVIKVGDGQITRTFKGESNRPYVNSNGTTTLLDEIMNGGTPKPDKVLSNMGACC
jgi:hypothetical protein